MTHQDSEADRLDDGGRSGNVVQLDQGLWQRLRGAQDDEAFAGAWLALLASMLPEARQAVLVRNDAALGVWTPSAIWPEAGTVGAVMARAVDAAIRQRRGVVRADQAAGRSVIALPVLFEDAMQGVAAVEVGAASRDAVRSVMRLLQWSVAWIEARHSAALLRDEAAARRRAATALDLVGCALEQEGFDAAAGAVVNELALELSCSRVSIGFVRRHRCQVTTLSNTARFAERTNLLDRIGQAMDEAIDQEATIVYPAPASAAARTKDLAATGHVAAGHVAQAHAALARGYGADGILTVPVFVGDEPIGAVTFERDGGRHFSTEEWALCDVAATVALRLLRERRAASRPLLAVASTAVGEQTRRLLGPAYLGRKMALLTAVALATAAWFVTDTYQVRAPAVLEGAVQRSIVAPFDGYVFEEFHRAGAVVESGTVLARLDDRDLALERLRWRAQARQQAAERDRAIAGRDRAAVNIIALRIEQAEAQVALHDAQIERARILAPFDGLIVEGDLSQQVGAAVRKGDPLFKIAPLDAYRLIVHVDETQIADVREGQEGRLLLAAVADRQLPLVVERVTPVALPREGRTTFRVDARLVGPTERLRPGMEGVARIDVDERRVVWIWTRTLVDWLRQAAWRWWPFAGS
ncbi:MAG: efflux RND transporter periplasmic adaptor subunit [Alphaproteobacteria bacterium]